jgi:hypothetical protein
LIRAFKRWRVRRRVKITTEVIVQVDKLLIATNTNREGRKQIWGDFIKHKTGREAIVSLLLGGGKRDLSPVGPRSQKHGRVAGVNPGSPEVKQ